MITIENINFYTINETAEKLHLNPMTIRKYISKGKIQSIRVGQFLIRESEINRLIGKEENN